MSYVYEIWIGDYFYQGSTNNLKKRISQHKKTLEQGRHDNSKFQNVWNKYKTFELQILVECDESVVRDYEQDYINANWGDPKFLNLNPNAILPPNQSGKTWIHSDKTKTNMSVAAKKRKNPMPTFSGKKHSDESKAKISAARANQKISHSAETKEKLSIAAKKRTNPMPSTKGIIMSEETKAKISAAKKGKPSPNKGKKMSDETKAKISATKKLAKNGEIFNDCF